MNAATDTLCSTLTSCLDNICPLSSRPARTAPSNPWLFDVLCEHQTRLRAAERKWRKLNDPSDLSRAALRPRWAPGVWLTEDPHPHHNNYIYIYIYIYIALSILMHWNILVTSFKITKKNNIKNSLSKKKIQVLYFVIIQNYYCIITSFVIIQTCLCKDK